MSGALKLTPREEREYSLSQALDILAGDHFRESDRRSGLAFDIDQELRKGAQQTERGERTLLMPLSLRAGLDTATATKGAELKFQQQMPWVDVARVQSVIGRAGATFLTDLQGTVTFPRLTTPIVPQVTTENPGGNVAQTDPAFGTSLVMTPHENLAYTAYSRQLLRLSSVVPNNSVDKFVATDIARAHAVKMDQQAMAGTGASGQVQGLFGVASLPSFAVGANGGQLSWPNVIDMSAVLAAQSTDFPDYGVGVPQPVDLNAWVSHPTIRTRAYKTDRAGAATGAMMMPDVSALLAYPFMVSQNIRSGLTKGTSSDCCDVYFGYWPDFLVGVWGPGVELVVDPFTKKAQGLVEVASWVGFDAGPRALSSFVVCSDARP